MGYMMLKRKENILGRKGIGINNTAANKMFLQWCRDELVLSFIFVQRLVSWDRTRLRKGTTAETQTLAGIAFRQLRTTNDRRLKK
jgi:hypothetical protein